ncbi:ribbon-helix-helix protein, CopG family [Aquabacterium sp. A7-Y]|uniref:ribbon-helix-helix protein, CopG family n=1 Tax=Aquabacterium sp. A7-Y TaxID=1349605 RepID=UPI00223D760B|nr:ribbon-helix-helix protein, CopG family [Aquabacterium sp. A7-Y]MCW7537031.1 ribbon-helix-helix protein, CopG family [Aquabacterium sp. A7-Y]
MEQALFRCKNGAHHLSLIEEFAMAVRFNVQFSDDLNEELDKVVQESESSKAEILRKALQLFLAAREGKKRGLKVGLVEPKTHKLETEIIGL